MPRSAIFINAKVIKVRNSFLYDFSSLQKTMLTPTCDPHSNDVGIPYITRQLKHYHSLLSDRSNKINQTTTFYGMQKQRLVANATGLNAKKAGNIDIANDLCGEGRRFAGGGAVLHIKRTEAFFRGVGLERKDREEYIERLARSGVTAIRTGVGWCVRNHVDPQKLKDAPPPCIGDLNCNPHTCIHSVVPESRKADEIARYRYQQDDWILQIRVISDLTGKPSCTPMAPCSSN